LTIAKPAHGSRFVLDPDRDPLLQILEISVMASPTTAKVILEVDGSRTTEASRPFLFQWKLTAGHHKFVALDSHGSRSEPVEIDVRASDSP
jgi:hypothetical protein